MSNERGELVLTATYRPEDEVFGPIDLKQIERLLLKVNDYPTK